MNDNLKSMSISNPHPPFVDGMQKLMIACASIGLLIMILSSMRVTFFITPFYLILSFILMTIGIIGFSFYTFQTKSAGIKNNGIWFSSTMARGLIGWSAGIVITLFYILLYWYPHILGFGNGTQENVGLIGFFDPLSLAFKGIPATQWFVYGTLYTFAILVFGIRFIWKYRHNRYQIIRTLSVMFFQLFFAFLIPEILESLNSDLSSKWFDKDLKNMWPLDYDFFDQWHIGNMSTSGIIGWGFLIFSLLLIFVISPWLTYKYGKRWYCSWVCGCGGLAETAGDPFRHLSDKSLKAWRIERWLIHSILVFAVVMTIAVIYGYLGDGEQYYITRTSFTLIVLTLLVLSVLAMFFFMKKSRFANKGLEKIIYGLVGIIVVILIINYLSGSGNAFIINNYEFKKWYGLLIGAAFSGVIGVGFYPIMGSRVWCRFGCPMAAILGIQQKFFSKFRITTNGNQCISCGNCSTYCEMGIDVRSYAQKGQNIVRASCVGCGICAAVCPRGVLKLENGSVDLFTKTDEIRNIHIS